MVNTDSDEVTQPDVLIPDSRNFLQSIKSEHTKYLGYLFIFFTFLLFGVVAILIIKIGNLAILQHLLHDINYEFLLTAFAGLGAAIYKVWDVMDNRLGTIDLFSSEIMSICRVIALTRMINGYVIWFFHPAFAKYVGESRKENYFAIFDCEGHRLGFLSRKAVTQVTAFYTFLKGARDAVALLPPAAEMSECLNSQVQLTIRFTLLNIVYLLFLCLEAAYYSLISLIGDEKEAKWKHMMLRDLALAYALLTAQMLEGDPRFRYLKNLRRNGLLDMQEPAVQEGFAEYDKLVNGFGNRNKLLSPQAGDMVQSYW